MLVYANTDPKHSEMQNISEENIPPVASFTNMV